MIKPRKKPKKTELKKVKKIDLKKVKKEIELENIYSKLSLSNFNKETLELISKELEKMPYGKVIKKIKPKIESISYLIENYFNKLNQLKEFNVINEKEFKVFLNKGKKAIDDPNKLKNLIKEISPKIQKKAIKLINELNSIKRGFLLSRKEINELKIKLLKNKKNLRELNKIIQEFIIKHVGTEKLPNTPRIRERMLTNVIAQHLGLLHKFKKNKFKVLVIEGKTFGRMYLIPKTRKDIKQFNPMNFIYKRTDLLDKQGYGRRREMNFEGTVVGLKGIKIALKDQFFVPKNLAKETMTGGNIERGKAIELREKKTIKKLIKRRIKTMHRFEAFYANEIREATKDLKGIEVEEPIGIWFTPHYFNEKEKLKEKTRKQKEIYSIFSFYEGIPLDYAKTNKKIALLKISKFLGRIYNKTDICLFDIDLKQFLVDKNHNLIAIDFEEAIKSRSEVEKLYSFYQFVNLITMPGRRLIKSKEFLRMLAKEFFYEAFKGDSKEIKKRMRNFIKSAYIKKVSENLK